MRELEQYLAEEIAIDCRDGFFSRREALRRLALLGVSAAAASALLTGCAGEQQAPSAQPQTSGSAPVPTPLGPPIGSVEAITYTGPEGRTLQGSWAAAEKARGGILVIHENKGLTDHFRAFPLRFAAAGYSALAVDLLSAEGGTAKFADPADATAALGKAPVERHVADLRAGLDELAKRSPGLKLGAVGFCFGGNMTWRLIGTKDERLAAAAPFYGPFPEGADYTGVKTAVLGNFAELDERVNKTMEAAKKAMTDAGLSHEEVVWPGVDHAFFNDTGKRYDATAAKNAWVKLLDWFGKHIG